MKNIPRLLESYFLWTHSNVFSLTVWINKCVFFMNGKWFYYLIITFHSVIVLLMIVLLSMLASIYYSCETCDLMFSFVLSDLVMFMYPTVITWLCLLTTDSLCHIHYFLKYKPNIFSKKKSSSRCIYEWWYKSNSVLKIDTPVSPILALRGKIDGCLLWGI